MPLDFPPSQAPENIPWQETEHRSWLLGLSPLYASAMPAAQGGWGLAGVLQTAGSLLLGSGGWPGAFAWGIEALILRCHLFPPPCPIAQAILSGMQEGRLLMAMAVSEPKAKGSHEPIGSRFVPAPGGFRLSGRKHWVTNGPVADWLLVLAQGDDDAAAFFIPREKAILEENQEPPSFLAGIPHGRFLLEKVLVGEEAKVPKEAFKARSRIFRAAEKALVLGLASLFLFDAAKKARTEALAGRGMALWSLSLSCLDHLEEERLLLAQGLLQLGADAAASLARDMEKSTLAAEIAHPLAWLGGGSQEDTWARLGRRIPS